MAQTVCEQCKAMVFLGEAACSNCGAPTPEEVASFGHEHDGDGTHGPPPEGLDLIVQKHLSDKKWGQEHNYEDGAMLDGYNIGRHHDNPVGMVGALASMSKPERDRDGKVIWDPKHALIGGIVVAICVGLIASYFYVQVQRYSKIPGYYTTTTIER